MRVSDARARACPSWCTECDRTQDRPDVPPSDRTVTHSARVGGGLSIVQTVWTLDGLCDGPNIWFGGEPVLPADARALAVALADAVNVAEGVGA
jgi:hypothetical protein